MKGAEEEATVTASRGGDGVAGRGASKKVAKFTEADKENFDVYGAGDTGLSVNRSPLPVGYPRSPLQDITAVLRPLNNNNSDEEGLNTGGLRKPITRSQGLRKMGNVHTVAVSERIAKNVNRAGPSKTRKKQVFKIAVDESKTVTLQGDAGQLKQETTRQLITVSSSLSLTEQRQNTEDTRKTSAVVSSSVSVTEQIQNTEDSRIAGTVVSSSISLTEQSQNTEDTLPAGTVSRSISRPELRQAEKQKWQKPLSERSSVSKFR